MPIAASRLASTDITAHDDAPRQAAQIINFCEERSFALPTEMLEVQGDPLSVVARIGEKLPSLTNLDDAQYDALLAELTATVSAFTAAMRSGFMSCMVSYTDSLDHLSDTLESGETRQYVAYTLDENGNPKKIDSGVFGGKSWDYVMYGSAQRTDDVDLFRRETERAMGQTGAKQILLFEFTAKGAHDSRKADHDLMKGAMIPVLQHLAAQPEALRQLGQNLAAMASGKSAPTAANDGLASAASPRILTPVANAFVPAPVVQTLAAMSRDNVLPPVLVDRLALVQHSLNLPVSPAPSIVAVNAPAVTTPFVAPAPTQNAAVPTPVIPAAAAPMPALAAALSSTSTIAVAAAAPQAPAAIIKEAPIAPQASPITLSTPQPAAVAPESRAVFVQQNVQAETPRLVETVKTAPPVQPAAAERVVQTVQDAPRPVEVPPAASHSKTSVALLAAAAIVAAVVVEQPAVARQPIPIVMAAASPSALPNQVTPTAVNVANAEVKAPQLTQTEIRAETPPVLAEKPKEQLIAASVAAPAMPQPNAIPAAPVSSETAVPVVNTLQSNPVSAPAVDAVRSDMTVSPVAVVRPTAIETPPATIEQKAPLNPAPDQTSVAADGIKRADVKVDTPIVTTTVPVRHAEPVAPSTVSARHNVLPQHDHRSTAQQPYQAPRMRQDTPSHPASPVQRMAQTTTGFTPHVTTTTTTTTFTPPRPDMSVIPKVAVAPSAWSTLSTSGGGKNSLGANTNRPTDQFQRVCPKTGGKTACQASCGACPIDRMVGRMKPG